jgi:hypothetical protein
MYSSSQAKTLEVNHPSLHVIEIFETEGGAVYKSVKQQDGVAAKKLQCPAARRAYIFTSVGASVGTGASIVIEASLTVCTKGK